MIDDPEKRMGQHLWYCEIQELRNKTKTRDGGGKRVCRAVGRAGAAAWWEQDEELPVCHGLIG